MGLCVVDCSLVQGHQAKAVQDDNSGAIITSAGCNLLGFLEEGKTGDVVTAQYRGPPDHRGVGHLDACEAGLFGPGHAFGEIPLGAFDAAGRVGGIRQAAQRLDLKFLAAGRARMDERPVMGRHARLGTAQGK